MSFVEESESDRDDPSESANVKKGMYTIEVLQVYGYRQCDGLDTRINFDPKNKIIMKADVIGQRLLSHQAPQILIL